MSKRKRIFTSSKYEKWIKEGRGSGEGSNYKPWITIQDVSSLGKSSRLLGIKTGRQHEFLSNNETNYFYIAEFSDSVIDIREQYPLLPIEDTMKIADELGIKHSTDPKSQEAIVLTTDFLLTIKDDNGTRMLARTIKQCDDLNKRQIDKFEVERRYWESKNIDWGIVTEKEINEVLAKNIELVYQFYDLKNIKGFENIATEQILYMVNEFKNQIVGNTIIRQKAYKFEENMLLERGCGIAIFKHLIITKQIHIDMLESINIDKELFIR